jgi:hypothetical protein
MSTNSPKPILQNDLLGVAKKWKIEFKLELEPSEGRNSQGLKRPEREARVQVLIDGRELDLEVGWDLLAIVASGRRPGGYYLGNCGCGEPGCSSIWHPMVVRHQGGTVTWSVPTPYSRKRSDNSPQEMVELSFDLMLYQSQSDGLVADFRRAATDAGALVRLNCYPGNLPLSLIAESEKGWEGYGGREDLPE